MTDAQRKVRDWRRDPVLFVQDNFKVDPDAWQVRALRSFGNQDEKKLRIALRACVGPGKTALLAWCAWNFLSCYGESGGLHPKGAAVSVTKDNLKDNLWPELAKWQSRSRYLMDHFTWTKERVFNNHHAETWFLSARSWSKTADAEEQGRTLSGLHSKYVLALIDESGEIPLPVLKAGEQAMAERDCAFGRILQAGNPSSLDGMLYAAAKLLSDQWLNIRVTGDPDDPERSPRIDIEWAKKQIATYGRDNPWIKYSILGEFPEASINALLGVDDVEKAMQRHYDELDHQYSQRRLGVDVARFGDDRTVLFPRQGLLSFMPVIMRNARSTEVAARIMAAKSKWDFEICFVDGTGGYGAGVIDQLITAGIGPVEVQFSGKPNDPRYFNKRSEMWFELAEWVKRGGALPNVPELVREATAATYTFQNGKLRVEEKDLIKEKIGASPDLIDALCTTFAIPDTPAANVNGITIPGIGKMKSDYDPLVQRD